MNQKTLYNFDAVEDSVESLFVHQGRQRPWTYWWFLLCVLSVIVALPFVRVDLSVGAAGLVRPAVERISIQAAMDGYITKLNVRDNEQVKNGEVLIVMQSRMLEEKIAYNRIRQQEITDKLADLALLISAAPDASTSTAPTLEKVGDDLGQRGISNAAFHTAAYLRLFEYFSSQLEINRLQSANAERELARVEALHAKGLATDQDFEKSRYARDGLLAERSQLLRQNLSRWQSDRLDQDSTQIQLQAEARQLAEQKELYLIRAPADGTAVGFVGLSVGTYVSAGARLGEVSPTGQLLIEVFVSSKDIGFIHPGQHAKIQVEAFPYSQWGTLNAVVRDVSHDIVQVGQQTAFKIILEMEDTKLHSSSGMTVNATKGMTVNARFVVSDRSLFDLLYQNTAQWLDPTGKAQ